MEQSWRDHDSLFFQRRGLMGMMARATWSSTALHCWVWKDKLGAFRYELGIRWSWGIIVSLASWNYVLVVKASALTCKKARSLAGKMIYNLKFSSKESSTKLINKTSVVVRNKSGGGIFPILVAAHGCVKDALCYSTLLIIWVPIIIFKAYLEDKRKGSSFLVNRHDFLFRCCLWFLSVAEFLQSLILGSRWESQKGAWPELRAWTASPGAGPELLSLFRAESSLSLEGTQVGKIISQMSGLDSTHRKIGRYRYNHVNIKKA